LRRDKTTRAGDSIQEDFMGNEGGRDEKESHTKVFSGSPGVK
jgi:hypothetical protein